MLKHIMRWTLGVSLLALATQSTVSATPTLTGRVTGYSPTSISVLDREIVTVTVDGRTAFTKWVTQKPWEQDTRLRASALRVGQLVAVHRRADDPGAASWVQIATDLPGAETVSRDAARPMNVATLARNQEASGDLLSPSEVVALIANARTSTDHLKLSKHYAAVAARYDDDAAAHAAEARAYRARGNPSETKRPGTPGTAAHCDRLSALAKDSATAARAISREHEAVASTAR